MTQEHLRQSCHGVDQLDGHTHISGLQACGEVGPQQGSVVDSLVEVVTLDEGHVLWDRVHLSVDVPRYCMDVAGHFLCKYKILFAHQIPW